MALGCFRPVLKKTGENVFRRYSKCVGFTPGFSRFLLFPKTTKCNAQQRFCECTFKSYFLCLFVLIFLLDLLISSLTA